MDWIADFFSSLLSFLFGIPSWLFDLVKACFVYLFDKLRWFVFDFGQWAFTYGVGLIDGCLSFAGYPAGLEWTSEYYGKLNYFIPLNELISVLVFLFALWLACFTVKVILKLIPWIY